MLIKTSELSGPALDWAVARCEGHTPRLMPDYGDDYWVDTGHGVIQPVEKYSTDWSQGGPIIDREKIDLMHIRRYKSWSARGTQLGRDAPPIVQRGQTALIAAMRCYVDTILGAEVNVPQKLLK